MKWGRWEVGMSGAEDGLKRTEAQAQVLADQVLPVEAVWWCASSGEWWRI